MSQFIQSNNIRFVDRAKEEYQPVAPIMEYNLLLSLLLGMMGGCGLAFLIESLDNTIKSTADLEQMIGVPLLGVVPSIDVNDLELITGNRERSNLCAHPATLPSGRKPSLNSDKYTLPDWHQGGLDLARDLCGSTRGQILYVQQPGFSDCDVG